jgi:hypothetical protein
MNDRNHFLSLKLTQFSLKLWLINLNLTLQELNNLKYIHLSYLSLILFLKFILPHYFTQFLCCILLLLHYLSFKGTFIPKYSMFQYMK